MCKRSVRHAILILTRTDTFPTRYEVWHVCKANLNEVSDGSLARTDGSAFALLPAFSCLEIELPQRRLPRRALFRRPAVFSSLFNRDVYKF